MKTLASMLVLVGVALVMAGACGGTEPVTGCTDDLDCKDDRVCESGVCVDLDGDDDDDDDGSGGAPSSPSVSSTGSSSPGSTSSSNSASQTVVASSGSTTSGVTSSTSVAATSVVSTAGPGPTTFSSAAPSSSSGGGCSLDGFFEDPQCDACTLDQCCSQAEDCVADFEAGGTQCIDFEGEFNPNGQLTAALFTCLETYCVDECSSGNGVCDTGLTYNDASIDACVDESCCTEFTACVGLDGSDAAACNACMEAGGGSLCDAYLECVADNGCFGWQVCDANLLVESEDVATCLGTNCCDVVDACFGTTEDDFDACVECLTGDAGGPLCDDVISCDADFGCGLL